jgi:hypothetical protein
MAGGGEYSVAAAGGGGKVACAAWIRRREEKATRVFAVYGRPSPPALEVLGFDSVRCSLSEEPLVRHRPALVSFEFGWASEFVRGGLTWLCLFRCRRGLCSGMIQTKRREASRCTRPATSSCAQPPTGAGASLCFSLLTNWLLGGGGATGYFRNALGNYELDACVLAQSFLKHSECLN